MACFIVVIPAFLVLLCVFGYIGEKIPDKAYKAIERVIFRCKI